MDGRKIHASVMRNTHLSPRKFKHQHQKSQLELYSLIYQLVAGPIEKVTDSRPLATADRTGKLLPQFAEGFCCRPSLL
jgi:hypothetical protein